MSNFFFFFKCEYPTEASGQNSKFITFAFVEKHTQYMHRCLELAKNGLGITNKRKRKIRALIQELRSSTDPVIRAPYKSSLVGLLRESSNFDSHYKVFANAVERWK